MKYKLPVSKITTLILLLALSVMLSACTIQELPVIGPVIGGLLPGGGDGGGGGGGGNGATQTSVSLTMWGLWENPEVMNDLIDQYQTLNPNVTINYEDRSVVKPVSSYKERVFNRLGEEGAPDIVRVHNSWVPRVSSLLAPMPSSMMSVQDYTSTFYDVSAESAVIDGKIYAIPLYYDGLALVYNKEHFEEVGQQSPPTAWEEFRKLSRELSLYSDNKLVRAGAAVGTADNIDHFSDILGLMWSQADVSIPEEIDNSAAQDALTFYTNFNKEDKVWSSSFPEASTAFANGTVSMIFVPSWKILDIIDASPSLDVGVAPVPQISASDPVSWGSFWMEGVSASSSNKKAAWDFLYFLSQREQQLSYFSQSSNYRPFGAPYARRDLADELSLNDYLRAYVLEASNATSAEIAARAGNATQVDALQRAVEEVLEGVGPGEALKRAKASMTR